LGYCCLVVGHCGVVVFVANCAGSAARDKAWVITEKEKYYMKITKEQIEQIPAGKELDSLIAEKIFKARRVGDAAVETIKALECLTGRWIQGDNWRETLLIRPLPEPNYAGCTFEFIQSDNYSSSIGHAWTVVIECQKTFTPVQWDTFIRTVQDYKMCRCILNLSEQEACLIICRAALIAALMEK
jgi:hypothetical protein